MRRFLADQYPLAALSSDEVIRRVILSLRSLGGVRAVFLFGSVARGEADALSDYDFAVLLDPGGDEREPVNAVAHALGTPDVGVQVLNDADEGLLRSVATFGRLLYERAPGEAEPILRHHDSAYTVDEMERGRMSNILGHLEECIGHLGELLAEGQESVFGDWRSLYALDRAIEMAAQDVIDFARRHGRRQGWEPPDSARHAIDLLAVNGVIAPETAGALAGLPGLRARLAHEYRNLDRGRLWDDLATGIASLRSFLAAARGLSSD